MKLFPANAVGGTIGRRWVVKAKGNLMPTSISVKEEARQLVEHLPEDATWEDVQHEVAFRQAVAAGLEDAAAGRTVSRDEARKRLGLGSS